MMQEPLAGLFPARNRLISGLSRVIVIVEAGEGSGALHTAHHAAEQGRTVMAVPGPPDAEASAGCNALIRDGAVLCRGADDVLEELHGVSAVSQAAKAAGARTRTCGEGAAARPDGRSAARVGFPGWRRADGGRIGAAAGNDRAAAGGALMRMEMKRAIRRLPGNRYERS